MLNASTEAKWISSTSGQNATKIIPVNIAQIDISASDGVEQFYTDSAEDTPWVPRPPWRMLSAGERAALVVDKVDRWADHLVLIELPVGLLQLAQTSLVERLAGTDGGRNDDLIDAIQVFRVHFVQALAEGGLLLDEVGPADLIVNRPGSPSTAYDYQRDRIIGLHIDNHQAMPLDSRSGSYTLANMNIGWRERYLHVVPLSLAGLLKDIGEGVSSQLLPRQIKDAYLGRDPQTAILRITIPPGVAYLLNTQNVIHDGATPSGDVPDVAFLTMGNPK